MPKPQPKIILFASGSGTNAERIMQQVQNSGVAHVAAVYCNVVGAGVVARAERLGVPVRLFNNAQLNDPDLMGQWLQQDAPDLIVLAGFLRKIPEFIVSAFAGKIVNIHPALLPKFGGKGMYGMHVHRAVKDSGAEETGITIHYVNAAYDEGAVIFQAKTTVAESDTPQEIALKVQILEHEHYPRVVVELLKERDHGQ
jgi:phosphoribosylglycinamide formyltransferase-1